MIIINLSVDYNLMLIHLIYLFDYIYLFVCYSTLNSFIFYIFYLYIFIISLYLHTVYLFDNFYLFIMFIIMILCLSLLLSRINIAKKGTVAINLQRVPINIVHGKIPCFLKARVRQGKQIFFKPIILFVIGAKMKKIHPRKPEISLI